MLQFLINSILPRHLPNHHNPRESRILSLLGGKFIQGFRRLKAVYLLVKTPEESGVRVRERSLLPTVTIFYSTINT